MVLKGVVLAIISQSPQPRGGLGGVGEGRAGRPISLQLGSCGPRSPESRRASFLPLYLELLLTLLKGSKGP